MKSPTVTKGPKSKVSCLYPNDTPQYSSRVRRLSNLGPARFRSDLLIVNHKSNIRASHSTHGQKRDGARAPKLDGPMYSDAGEMKAQYHRQLLDSKCQQSHKKTKAQFMVSDRFLKYERHILDESRKQSQIQDMNVKIDQDVFSEKFQEKQIIQKPRKSRQIEVKNLDGDNVKGFDDLLSLDIQSSSSSLSICSGNLDEAKAKDSEKERKSSSNTRRLAVNGLIWDQGAPRSTNNNFLKMGRAGELQEQLGLSPRASTNASSRFKHCCSMQVPYAQPNVGSDTHLRVNSNRSGTKSQNLENKSVGKIMISRRSSNSMRPDVVYTHSYNNFIEHQETQRPDNENTLTLDDNAPSSDSESNYASSDSMNVMISKAQRKWRSRNMKHQFLNSFSKNELDKCS